MAHEFVVTPIQIWQAILIICGGIITIGGAVTLVKKWWKGLKKPQTDTKNEVKNIEATLEQYEEYFKKDKEAIDELKKGQNIMYRSHLALISHAIDGNNTGQLKEVKNDLEEFLIER